MTATAFKPTGNPVRRFVLALAATAVAATALWFSGLAAPRLAVVSAGPPAGSAGGDALRGTLVVRLRNDGPLPVEVRSAEFLDPRLDAGALRPAGLDLSGGESATFEVDYTIDCDASAAPAMGRLAVTVTTPLRIERTSDVGDTGLADGTCPLAVATGRPGANARQPPPRPGSSPPPAAGPGSPRPEPGPVVTRFPPARP